MWSLAHPSLPAHCVFVQLARTGILFFSAYSNASWRHLTGGRPWNCSASCFKCLASSSSILSVNILFASATAPQATDFTSPFSFFFMNLRRLDLSIFLSLAAALIDFFPSLTSAAALSISSRGVLPQVVFLVYCLGMMAFLQCLWH